MCKIYFNPEYDDIDSANFYTEFANLSCKCPGAPFGDPEPQNNLDCFCSSKYDTCCPITTVIPPEVNGWILLLDDDKVLVSNNSVSRMLLHTTSRHSLLLLKSSFGSVIPSEKNNEQTRGETCMNNIMLHSSMLQKLDIHADARHRCFDFFLASELRC